MTALTGLLTISLSARADDSLLAVYCLDDTDGAGIFPDGKKVSSCTSGSRQSVPVSAGQHSVEVVKEYGREFEQRFSTSINVIAGQPVRVRATEYGRRKAEQERMAGQYAADKKEFDKNLIAARSGNIAAMGKLALFYRDSKGTEKDPEQSAYWQKFSVSNSSPCNSGNRNTGSS